MMNMNLLAVVTTPSIYHITFVSQSCTEIERKYHFFCSYKQHVVDGKLAKTDILYGDSIFGGCVIV